MVSLKWRIYGRIGAAGGKTGVETGAKAQIGRNVIAAGSTEMQDYLFNQLLLN